MYHIKPQLVIGFHGCDVQKRDAMLRNPNEYKISQKPYDWLGHGLYFWENNYDRALQWAHEKKERGKIVAPAVVGAVLYLGHCCDFLDRRFISVLATHYERMESNYKALGKDMPQNKDAKDDRHKNKLLRDLDCAVIEFMHARLYTQVKQDIRDKGFSEYQLFDSTRGVFTEGGEAFTGAGILEKSHIQICIRNPNCIQGFFMPREETNFMDLQDKKYLL